MLYYGVLGTLQSLIRACVIQSLVLYKTHVSGARFVPGLAGKRYRLLLWTVAVLLLTFTSAGTSEQPQTTSAFNPPEVMLSSEGSNSGVPEKRKIAVLDVLSQLLCTSLPISE